MILVDANVLLYAVDRNSPRHDAARRWLEGALSGSESIGFAWLVLLAFLRLATRPAVLRRPITVETAMAIVDDWLSAPPVRLVEAGPNHWAVLRRLLAESGAGGNLTSDAHLAALALGAGAAVATFDHDFRRFAGLRVVVPARPGRRGESL